MVKITNGVETLVVPEGSVKVYKTMGFTVVGENKHSKKHNKPKQEQKQEDAGTEDFEDLLSKPISQWNQEEVKEYAAAKGYDVSGAKSLKQAKEIIKAALDEEERALAGEM